MVSIKFRVLSLALGAVLLGLATASNASEGCHRALIGNLELTAAEKIDYLRRASKNVPNQAFGLQSMAWLQDPYQPFLVRKEIFNQLRTISMRTAIDDAYDYFSATEKVELIREIMNTELPAFNFAYHEALQFFTMDRALPLFIRIETFRKLLSIRNELPVMEMLESFEGSHINSAIEILLSRQSWDVMESYRFEESVRSLVSNFIVRLDLRQVLLARYLDRFEESSRIRRDTFTENEWRVVFQYLYTQHRSKMTAKATLALDQLSVRINSKPVWQKLYERFFSGSNQPTN